MLVGPTHVTLAVAATTLALARAMVVVALPLFTFGFALAVVANPVIEFVRLIEPLVVGDGFIESAEGVRLTSLL
jgi:hypothetical protein